MTHNEIVAHVADAFDTEYGFEVVTECHPHPDTQNRIDVVVFERRRPTFCVEVKRKLRTHHQIDVAVRQVEGYVQQLRGEMPRAIVLPLVVAEEIGPQLNASPWRQIALVWSLEMFDRVAGGREWYQKSDRFFRQWPDGTGPIPYTFGKATWELAAVS